MIKASFANKKKTNVMYNNDAANFFNVQYSGLSRIGAEGGQIFILSSCLPPFVQRYGSFTVSSMCLFITNMIDIENTWSAPKANKQNPILVSAECC